MKSPKRNKKVRRTSASRLPAKTKPSRRQGRSHIPVRPFVVATFAMTVDGKITTRTFSPIDFTSREDKAHLFHQRSLGDAVLIGAGTLRHDNVRLGLPGTELRDERLARKQTPYPIRVIVSNAGRIDPHLKIFQSDISPIVIFSTTRMPKKFQDALRTRSTLHLTKARSVDLAAMLQQLRARLQSASRRLRGRRGAFSQLAGARSCRSTECDNRAVHVRRSERTNTYRLEQRILAEERSLLAARNADRRRRMFFDLPDQTLPLIPAESLRCYFSCARPPNEFTVTIRTDILHLLGAIRTKGALIDANECRRVCRESFLALFAAIFHFQRHFDLFSLRDGLSCRATNLTPSIRAHRQLDYHSRAARNDL